MLPSPDPLFSAKSLRKKRQSKRLKRQRGDILSASFEGKGYCSHVWVGRIYTCLLRKGREMNLIIVGGSGLSLATYTVAIDAVGTSDEV